MEATPLVSIKDLDISFGQNGKVARALRGIDLTLYPKEIHGLVGESGSGKTVTSTAIMGLLSAPPASINRGSILFNGREILHLSEQERRKIRGKEMAMIFQEPGKYLNPAFRIGTQITEMLILHLGMNKAGARDRALEILDLVGLGRDDRVLRSYPHELSGGMKQRAMIAMAICCDPAFLIADEPTTALDVTLQLQILKLIIKLKDLLEMGILFISHDLGVVEEISDRVSVIYAGRIVETAPKAELFRSPRHPYTKLLMLSIPDAKNRGKRLVAIPGRVPDAESIPAGCAFHPRCPLADEGCREGVPELAAYEPQHNVACHYAGKEWKVS